MKVLIVDDEKKSRQVLVTLLNKYCEEVSAIELAESAEVAIFQINRFNPDLIFLDIEMPEINGFNLLDRLDANNFLICFATGYEKYSLKAFSYGAFGYLLKPISIQELKKVVSRAHKQVSLKESIQPTSIVLKEGSKFFVVPYEDILHIKAFGNNSIITKIDGRIISDLTLNQLEELLPAELIFRIHRSHMVNLNKVKTFNNGRTGSVILQTDEEVPIANRRIKEFIKLFSALQRNK